MAEKKGDALPDGTSAQEVDRIRDIIFGAQMRDYEQRFQNIQRDMNRLQQELDGLANRQIDQEKDKNEKLQGLRREMRDADHDLREELRQTAQTLIQEKVDRATLGELFIELGTHLKTGGSLTDLLESLGKVGE